MSKLLPSVPPKGGPSNPKISSNEQTNCTVIEWPAYIYLNIFSLYDKPCNEQDQQSFIYLDCYNSFLRSELLKDALQHEDCGIPKDLITTLQYSLEQSSKAWRACEEKALDPLIQITSDQLNDMKPSENGKFFVMHFPHHSCDLIFTNHPSSSDHLVVIPMELRIPSTPGRCFSQFVEDKLGKGEVSVGRRIALPQQVLVVQKRDISKLWLSYMADLQMKLFEGALPCGTGRANDLPDNREVPSQTYVYEWLLPLLVPTALESLGWTHWQAWKTVSHQKNQGQQGVPWRRSHHWTSIRFAVSLSQRRGGFSLGSYKNLQLLFFTWLAEQYSSRIMNIETICKSMEMIKKIHRKMEKMVANSHSTAIVSKIVSDNCKIIREKVNSMFTRITQWDYTLPDMSDFSEIDGMSNSCFSPKLTFLKGIFSFPSTALLELQKGPTVGLDTMKEQTINLVSPSEWKPYFIQDSVFTLRTIIKHIKQAFAISKSQKKQLADWTRLWMMAGTENFVFHLVGLLTKGRFSFTSTDICVSVAIHLEELAQEYLKLLNIDRHDAPEQNSRSALVLWSCFVLVDSIARSQFPEILRKHQLALPEECLEKLMFRNRLLMEVAADLVCTNATWKEMHPNRVCLILEVVIPLCNFQ